MINIGDKVRLISKRPRQGFGGAHTGSIGEVVRVEGGTAIVISFPEHPYWSGYQDEVELYSVDNEGFMHRLYSGDPLDTDVQRQVTPYYDDDLPF